MAADLRVRDRGSVYRAVSGADDANKANNRWLMVDVARVGQVVARLRVLRKASIDKEKWIVMEFDNQGTSPVELLTAQYNIIADCADSTGKGPSFRGMGDANKYALFSEAWQTEDVRKRGRWCYSPEFIRLPSTPATSRGNFGTAAARRVVGQGEDDHDHGG